MTMENMNTGMICIYSFYPSVSFVLLLADVFVIEYIDILSDKII